MRLSQLHYLPLPAPLFFALALSFLVLVALIQLGVLQYAYTRLGISARAALLLLLGSLLGSYLNLPLAELPCQEVLSGRVVDYFGMRYFVPVVLDWPGTIIAVNVGGALIPILMSIYLLSKNGLWGRG
ncbi:MAG: DUF1614 domain-containing protein, partial [Mesorhizobium sp.]